MFLFRVLISDSFNPWFNLAVEDYIFSHMLPDNIVLFLWRNNNTVVIGRSQNPWKECNTSRMLKDGIKLARRNSGGGAVFHDLGNICFTFICNTSLYRKHFFYQIILDGLSRLGIRANLTGRNDLVVQTDSGERKIGGSAYRENKYYKLHHGTILLHTDLKKLSYYLTPNVKKLFSKGINSVASRVMNLNEICTDINHQQLFYIFQQSFFSYFGSKLLKPEIISSNSLFSISELSKIFFKYSNWYWNFGSIPIFTHQLERRFNWGGITLCFNVDHGIITNNRLFTDSLYLDPLEELSKKLNGIKYSPKEIKECCNKWIINWSNDYETLYPVINWLMESLM